MSTPFEDATRTRRAVLTAMNQLAVAEAAVVTARTALDVARAQHQAASDAITTAIEIAAATDTGTAHPE